MTGSSLARTFSLIAFLAVPLFLPTFSGCKKPPTSDGTNDKGGAAPDRGGGKAAVVVGQAPTAATPLDVGMADPVPRLTSATAKALQHGYKALNAKNWEDCATAFTEVTTAVPDYLDARFYTARALLNQAKAAEARQQLEELLKRNYPAYVGRATTGKDWLALRTSPEWAAYQQAEARLKATYATGLQTGLVLVLRTSPGKPIKYEPVANAALAKEGLREAKLDLKQEVVHFDPASARYRFLTHSEGRVIAAQRSPDGKTVVVLYAERTQHKAGKLWLVDPQLGFVDLTTLETAGPIPLVGSYEHIAVGFSKDGVPTWAATAAATAAEAAAQPGGTFQIDSAKTGAVKVAEEHGLFGERTEVWADDLQHSERRLPADVKPALDLQSFIVSEPGSDAGKSVTSALKLAGDSFAWSPGHKQLVYAGAFDACAALDKRKEVQKDKNGLFLYDASKKAAQRIDATRTTYETQWISDELLAFETGIDADSRVTVYNVTSGEKTVLQTRHGGGLYGVSAHKCDEPPQSADDSSGTTDPAAPTLPAPPPVTP